jgi:hypothetical protein
LSQKKSDTIIIRRVYSGTKKKFNETKISAGCVEEHQRAHE